MNTLILTENDRNYLTNESEISIRLPLVSVRGKSKTLWRGFESICVKLYKFVDSKSLNTCVLVCSFAVYFLRVDICLCLGIEP